MRGLRKSFGPVNIIKSIDLEIAHGELVVFVGPSGCGKSTLLRMIAGLEDITEGELRIGGVLCNGLAPKDRGIAMVFQSYALYPHKSVYDNMAFGLKISKTPKAEIESKVREAARILQMEHLLARRPAQLSGGQRQRVAIGRAIVRNPRIFLFDEPLSNLDAALRVSTRAEIAKLHADLNATMIYVTHDQVEAMTLADRIVVLEAGNVRQIGTPLELYHLPETIFVAGFIGSPKMNFFEVDVAGVSDAGVTIASAGLGATLIPVEGETVQQSDRLVLGIRPEHLGTATAPASVHVTVQLVERLGHETIIQAVAPGGQSVTGLLGGEVMVSAGQDLTLHFAPANAHLFREDGQALRRRIIPEIVAMTRASRTVAPAGL
jgi:multiple sugar transport system ATP-binding protein